MSINMYLFITKHCTHVEVWKLLPFSVQHESNPGSSWQKYLLLPFCFHIINLCREASSKTMSVSVKEVSCLCIILLLISLTGSMSNFLFLPFLFQQYLNIRNMYKCDRLHSSVKWYSRHCISKKCLTQYTLHRVALVRKS